MAICGLKLSICCSVLSVWGIIQLLIMGGLFWSKSVALLEDLPEVEIDKPEKFKSLDEWQMKYYEQMGEYFDGAATNCWICAGLYVISLLFSLSQWYLNKKRQS